MARIVCSINLKVAAFFFAVSAGYCLGFVIKADTGRRGSWRQDAASVFFFAARTGSILHKLERMPTANAAGPLMQPAIPATATATATATAGALVLSASQR